jgi:hypothetical protein
MRFKPEVWQPIALVLTAVNLAGAGFAIGTAEPLHAAVHGALAVACGFWAGRLRRGPGAGGRQAEFEELEAEVSDLRAELTEAQERLDFAERMLAQRPETHRVDQQR